MLLRADEVLRTLETPGQGQAPRPVKSVVKKRPPVTEVEPPEGKRKVQPVGPSLFGEAASTMD